MPIPQDIWERMKLFLAERRTGTMTVSVIGGQVTALTLDGEASSVAGDPTLRALLRELVVEVLSEPANLDRLLDRARHRVSGGKSLTAVGHR